MTTTFPSSGPVPISQALPDRADSVGRQPVHDGLVKPHELLTLARLVIQPLGKECPIPGYTHSVNGLAHPAKLLHALSTCSPAFVQPLIER